MNNLTRLFAYIDANKNTPFEWGKFDCCLFAANAIKVATGSDIAADFRGKYNTARGAKKALKRYGNGDLISTVIAKLGDAKPPLQAKRGDLVLVDNLQGGVNDPALGICLGHLVAVTTQTGLKTVELTRVTMAWEVLCHQ